MNVLVTGGAGYIGAHVVAALRKRGEVVVTYDDLSSGDELRLRGGPIVVASLLDSARLEAALRDNMVELVVHVAGKKNVEESVRCPMHYYRENVGGMESLLTAMAGAGVDRLVFSSSAAVYGLPPSTDPVTESTPLRPMNPYGDSKLICEWMLRAQSRARGLRWVALRYFNVAGAVDPLLGDTLGENLIPRAFRAITAGNPPTIFGDDYDTPDGTCIRDYVHVADIAAAHAAVLPLLNEPRSTWTFNVGTGRGYSVREVLDVVRAVTGASAPATVVERRPGDPPRIVADVTAIERELGWRSRHGLADMVESAWEAWCAGELHDRPSWAPT
jgi:UDP-glucose 4-epimerase